MLAPVAASSSGAPVIHVHNYVTISGNTLLGRDQEVAEAIADRIQPYLNRPSIKGVWQ